MRNRSRLESIILALLLLPGLSGCFGSDSGPGVIQPAHFTNVRIFQQSVLVAPGNPGYQGYIKVCAFNRNPNEVDIMLRSGEEFYQVPPSLNGSLVLVQKDESTKEVDARSQGARIVGHDVYAPELGQSPNYSIHIWTEIVSTSPHFNPQTATKFPDPFTPLEPPVRFDKWYNITFELGMTKDHVGNISDCLA